MPNVDCIIAYISSRCSAGDLGNRALGIWLEMGLRIHNCRQHISTFKNSSCSQLLWPRLYHKCVSMSKMWRLSPLSILLASKHAYKSHKMFLPISFDTYKHILVWLFEGYHLTYSQIPFLFHAHELPGQCEWSMDWTLVTNQITVFSIGYAT